MLRRPSGIVLRRPQVGGGGGPALEALAREGDARVHPLPVPLRNAKAWPPCIISRSLTRARTSSSHAWPLHYALASCVATPCWAMLAPACLRPASAGPVLRE